MLNTDYLCQPVIDALAEHDKIAQEKSKKPITKCRDCHGCSNPILAGSLNGNQGCNKPINTTILSWCDSEWINSIASKKEKN